MRPASRRLEFFRFAGVSAFIVTTCAGCPFAPDFGDQNVSGEAVARRILDDDPYTEWGQFPTAEGFVDAGFPHGPETRVFINDVLLESLGMPKEAFPDGSMIVKENDEQDVDVFGLSNTLDVMWKVEGYNPQNNDWFWTNLTRDGEVNFEGRVQVCIRCHDGARDNDFIFLYPLDEPG